MLVIWFLMWETYLSYYLTNYRFKKYFTDCCWSAGNIFIANGCAHLQQINSYLSAEFMSHKWVLTFTIEQKVTEYMEDGKGSGHQCNLLLFLVVPYLASITDAFIRQQYQHITHMSSNTKITQLVGKVSYLKIYPPINSEMWSQKCSKSWLRRPINIPVSANFLNISDWQRTRQEWRNKYVASKDQTLLWRIVNRNSVRRTVTAVGWCSFEKDLVAGIGLDSWYKTSNRWIGGRWFRTGICWCSKVVAGSGLVAAGSCWRRKVVAGSGRWSLIHDW